MESSLKKIIAKAPVTPGVYKFLGEKKEVLYVGKAKNLRKRLQSYARQSADRTPKIEKMLEKAAAVEWISTNNEIESLILEDNLIKELQPRYNARLRDDKHFQYIKISLADDYPEITTVRRIAKKDGSKYFGPKTGGGDTESLMESVKKIFRLCSVRNITVDPKSEPLPGAKTAVRVGGVSAKRPCLDFYIKRCTGPCAGMVTPGEYRLQIEAAVDFLSGNYKPAIESLKKQMADFAAEKKFERAAALRDQIQAIERSAQKQLITDTAMPDRDVIAFAEDLGKSYFVLFQIRAGRLIAQERFVEEGGESPAEVMEAFLRDYYALAADIPGEIFISVEVEEEKLLEAYIRERAGRSVGLFRPQAGFKDDLVLLALKNARAFAEASRASWETTERKAEAALAELAKALRLKAPPKRMECYDISHLGGTETVGSMVVFKNGKPSPADYRQFRLRSTANKNDDYKSMEEVLTRRLNYLPARLPEGYKIRKAKKGDLKFIQDTVKKNPLNQEDIQFKQFYVIEKSKRIVGFCRERALSDTVHDISVLWVDPKERGHKFGYHLMKKCIESSKQKRLYMSLSEALKEYHLAFGWEEVAKAPQPMIDKVERAGKAGMDISDNCFLAYQKKKRDLSFEAFPDLIVIDGGKGQLGVAQGVLGAKELAIPLISLAKKEEEVYAPGNPNPVDIAKNSEAGYLLQRLRDEAHRFAVTKNRAGRDAKMVKSALDDIVGIGPKMKKKLLAHFGSVEKIREASEVQLQSFVGPELAARIKENL